MSDQGFFVRHKRALLGAAASVFVLGAVIGGPNLAPQFGSGAAIAQQRAEVVMRPASFADVVERVKPAVVAVQVRREGGAEQNTAQNRGRNMPGMSPDDPLWRFFREFQERQQGQPGQGAPNRGPSPVASQGSGFFISADGFLVTNNHVVQGGSGTVTVIMDDGSRVEARIVGSDPRTDLAVLKAEREQPFPFVNFSGVQPRVGDWVIAIGNPFGLGGSVTAGIVSARGRDIGAGPYDDFIQIDAPVNRGNSGGPAFDANGDVIGINTAIYSPSGGSVGIGFAIPATTAQSVVDQIRRTGSVTRGWLGVQIQSLNEELARTLGLPRAEGALVAEPQPDSPAARAGIRSGDVIVGLNGEPVRDARELTRRVAGLEPDANARFEVVRNGERQTIEVRIGRLQETQAARAGAQPGRQQQPQDDGAEVLAGLGVELATGRNGVTVVDIDPRGAAARRGLRQGDVIVEIGGEAVSSPRDVQARLRRAGADGRGSVIARVRSQGGVRLVPLPVDRS